MNGQRILGSQSCSVYLSGPSPCLAFGTNQWRRDEPLRADPRSILQRQAALWAEHGLCTDLLLRGEAQAEAEAWAASHADELTDAERDLLEESRQMRYSEQRTHRMGRLIQAMAMVMLLLCLVASHLALQGRQETAAQGVVRATMEAQLTSAVSGRATASAAATSEAQARTRAEMDRAVAQEASRRALDQSRQSESSALAAWSYGLAESDPQLATLLALEAVRRMRGSMASGVVLPSKAGAAIYRALGHLWWEAALVPVQEYLPAWISLDGRVAGAAPEGQICIWDALTGELLLRLAATDVDLLHVAWSPDGQRLATGHRDGSVIIWDSRTGQQQLALSGHSGWAIASSWSDSGDSIVTCGGEGRALVWDAATGRQRFTLGGHGASLVRAEWQSSDSRIITYWDEDSYTAWSALDGRRLFTDREPVPDGAEPPSAADSRLMLAHLVGGSIRVASTDDLMALGCAHAGRNMTQDEWEDYVGKDVPYRRTCACYP